MSTDSTGDIKMKLNDYWRGIAQENEYLKKQIVNNKKALNHAKEFLLNMASNHTDFRQRAIAKEKLIQIEAIEMEGIK